MRFITNINSEYFFLIQKISFLGPALLDVISSAMNISIAVLSRAEQAYGSCTDMVYAAEEISAYISDVQKQKVYKY